MTSPALLDTFTDEELSQDYSRRELSINRKKMVNSVKWGWFNDIGWNPHLHQMAAHRSLARIRTTCAGRRGGKSEWAGREASAYMIAGPFRVWIVAPSYDLGFKEFRVVVNSLLHPSNPYKIEKLHTSRKAGNLYVLLSNGAECEVISIDKPRKSGHGEEVDLIILSECGLMDNIGGEDGVWNKTLKGAMTTRHAEVIIPTTPQGEDDFLHPTFMKGLNPDNPISNRYRIFKEEYIDLREYYKCKEEYDSNYFSLQWPSWLNVEGFLEDVQELYDELPRRIFMEQYGGFFVRWSGSVWMGDFCYDPITCLVEPFSIPHWWRRIEIIDPGFSGLFAWIAAYVDDECNIYIVDEYSAKRTLYKEHVEAIQTRRREFAAVFHPEHPYDPDEFIPVYIDPEDPQCAAELNALGLACTPANNDVVAGFQSGAIKFRSGILKIFIICIKVDKALRNHEWARQKNQGARAKEAQDAWKHFSDLIRYLCLAALWAAEKPAEAIQDDGIYRETVGDLINMSRQADLEIMNLSRSQWEARHA